MATHNANNERIKRRHSTYLKEAMRYSEASVDGVAKALSRFEEMTRYRDFKAFHFEQAVAFKRRLADQVNPKTGRKLSKATLNGTLACRKRFFHWLAGQPV
jgi:integrase/recombinase XerD